MGGCRLITLGLLLGGITMGIMLLSGNFIVLAIVISLFGLGLATVTASTSALVADLSRVYSRGGALGVLSSIMDIGHSTGPMAAGILISAYSYQTAFILIGAGLTAASISYGLGMWRLSARMNSSR